MTIPGRGLVVEDILRLRHLAEAVISPDGSKGAAIVHGLDDERDLVTTTLVVVLIDTGVPTTIWTGARLSQPSWSPDSRWTALIAQDGAGPAIVCIDTRTGVADTVVRGLGGLLAPRWSPDGTRLAFLAYGPDRRGTARPRPEEDAKRIDLRTGPIVRAGFEEAGTGWLRKVWVVDLRTGEARQVSEGPYEDGNSSAGGDLAWSPDGESLIFGSNRGPEWRYLYEGASLFRLDLATGKTNHLTPGLEFAARPVHSPDGRYLAFLGSETADRAPLEYPGLHVLELATGRRRCLTEGLDRAVGFTHAHEIDLQPIWTEQGDALMTSLSDDGHTNLVRIGLDGAITQLTSGTHVIQSVSADATGECVLFIYADPVRPSELHSLQGLRETVIYAPNADALAGVRFVPPLRHSLDRKGVRIPYWLLLPQDSQGKVPVIVEIHGGPNNAFSDAFYFDQQLWAAHGYAVIYGNSRGSYGYSRSFYNACVEDLVGDDALDVLAMLDHALAAEPSLDAQRTAVAGYSYGGYMANQLITITGRFKAAVSGAGISNLISYVGTADLGRWFEKVYHGGSPADRLDWYVQRSPVLRADRVTTPLLIYHGDRDTRVPISQADELVHALTRQGVKVELYRMPGEDHSGIRRVGIGNAKPAHQVAVREAVLRWFERHLKALA